MPRLWTANKSYTDSLNANTRYLVGASNGACNYQTIPEGSTKRVLHGAASGACYYGNETVPLPSMVGNISNLPTGLRSLSFPITQESYVDIEGRTITVNNTDHRYDCTFSPSDTRGIHSEPAGVVFNFNGQFNQQYYNILTTIKRLEVWITYRDNWVKYVDITNVRNFTHSDFTTTWRCNADVDRTGYSDSFDSFALRLVPFA